MISDNFKRAIANLLPFFYMGIMIVVLSLLFFFFLYIGIIGAIIGCAVYLIIFLKDKFFGKSKKSREPFHFKNKVNTKFYNKGRTFDNDEQV